jgi:formamidopyrimidine-DNA glycosylase
MPEMENYKRLLIPRMTGRAFTEAEVSREKSVNMPVADFRRRLLGTRVQSVGRRAKYLLFHLDSGDVLLLHLMLSGLLFWGKAEKKPDRTVQVRLSFGEEHLHFIGLRLGYLHLLTGQEAAERLAQLGPEAADPAFGKAAFARLLQNRRGLLKPALVDQSFIAGIGNCYSDEICFAAGIRPSRTIASLAAQESAALHRAMHAVLAEAAAGGGYMEMPLYAGDILTGAFNERFRVYDREGEPCILCGETIVRKDIGSRKSFYCTTCQR